MTANKMAVTLEKDGILQKHSMVKECKVICIQCCFAKGSRVMMAGRSLKCVEDITIGDEVEAADGTAAQVKNIHSGRERKVTVLETRLGKRIRLTSDHPVFLEDGTMRPASSIVKDTLVLATMQRAMHRPDVITNVYEEKYNDTVFNLSFDKPTKIIVEGFILGDFDFQQMRKM